MKTSSLQSFSGISAIFVFLGFFSISANAQKLTFKIPPTKIHLKVKDQLVTITAFGVVSLMTQERDLSVFTIELDADLADLQQNITPLLSEALDKDDRCGDRITIQRATILPVPPASLTTVELHYERWGCAKIFGKEQTKKLIGGNAVVQMKLTPSIDKENGELRLDPEIGQIQADGSLGELLRSGSLGDMLREKIRASMLAALQKGTNLTSTLPRAIQGQVTIHNVGFKDAGAGRLLVELDGEARLTRQQIQALSEQVKEHAASVR